MGKSSAVDISALRETINEVLTFIEKDLKIPQVTLAQDLYWEIDRKDVYALDKSSPRVNCGNLVDDWEFILEAHKKSEQALPLLFMHIAPILQALAEAVPSFKDPTDDQK